MAEQVVAFDEDLPPVDLLLDAVEFGDLAAAHPAGRYLLPCRGSDVDLPGAVSFLDTRPAERQDWVLIGCERPGSSTVTSTATKRSWSTSAPASGWPASRTSP